jgi:hypothetical protein
VVFVVSDPGMASDELGFKSIIDGYYRYYSKIDGLEYDMIGGECSGKVEAISGMSFGKRIGIPTAMQRSPMRARRF